MKRFAWSAVTFHENELEMGVVEVNTKEEAMIHALTKLGIKEEEDKFDEMDSDSIQEWAFDVDILVNAIEI